MTVLETERLILRPWQPEDFDAFGSMCAEPEVVRFTTIDAKPMSRTDAWGAFAYQMGHWLLRGFGQFAVVERTGNAIIGRAGPWQPEGWPEFEVQCVLRRKYWGQGYERDERLVSFGDESDELGFSKTAKCFDMDFLNYEAVVWPFGAYCDHDFVNSPKAVQRTYSIVGR